MKYVEQIKSILLTFLVLLSVMLTLLIWNYKPDYEFIEETQVEEIMIGETRQLQEVLRPYRVLFRQEDQYYGTVSTEVIENLYANLSIWQTQGMDLISRDLTDEEINELLRMNNRITLFFNEETPLQVFSGALGFDEKELPDMGFTHLILDWSTLEKNDQMQLFFLNAEKRLLFQANVELSNVSSFMAEVVEPAKEYSPYIEVERDSLRSLYVAQDPINSVQYTYLFDSISPDTFKSILFSDPGIVKQIPESLHSEKYVDGTSLMTVDTQNRILNYVYPPAESIAPIPSASLLQDSFEFVNDHGGFTADYRLSSINVGKHIIEYQLFLQGYPIYSSMTTARIVTTWGENRIFRYRRPYYSIESDITQERVPKQLTSGEDAIAHIKAMEDYPFDEIDEVVVGYYLMQNQEKELFILEPSWFVISNNVWTRISPERLGGAENGLE